MFRELPRRAQPRAEARLHEARHGQTRGRAEGGKITISATPPRRRPRPLAPRRRQPVSGPVIISLADAKGRGLKRYFTGEPCKHGHVAPRIVDGRQCVPCRLLVAKAWRRAHAEELRAARKTKRTIHGAETRARDREARRVWRAANPTKVKEQKARSYKKHQDAILRRRREFYLENRDAILRDQRMGRSPEKVRAYNQRKYYKDVEATREKTRVSRARQRAGYLAHLHHIGESS